MPRTYGTTNVTPSASAPAVGVSGDQYWNTANKVLYVSDGTAWQPAISSVLPINTLGVATANVGLGAFRLTNVGGAIGGLDALNRNTADARYTMRAFTSTSDRDTQIPTPTVGQMCVTTDTGSLWQYFTGGWYRPNARLARVSTSTDINGITTSGVATAATSSVFVPGNRLLSVIGHYNFATINNGAYMYARMDTTPIAGRMAQFNGANSLAGFSLDGQALVTPTSGNHSFDVVLVCIGSTVNMIASQDLGWFEVWDRGAA